jgi:hypothetical protein
MSRTTIAGRGPMKCCMCPRVLAGAALDCIASGCDFADAPGGRANEPAAASRVQTEFAGSPSPTLVGGALARAQRVPASQRLR